MSDENKTKLPPCLFWHGLCLLVSVAVCAYGSTVGTYHTVPDMPTESRPDVGFISSAPDQEKELARRWEMLERNQEKRLSERNEELLRRRDAAKSSPLTKAEANAMFYTGLVGIFLFGLSLVVETLVWAVNTDNTED